MSHLFGDWGQIAERLRSARAIALFLDFDGTLSRLRLRPEDVRLNESTRRAIARLASHPRVQVWVISGRRLDDVRSRMRVRGVHYVGLHGWEDGLKAPLDSETARLVERAKRKLARQIEAFPGIRIEDKGPVFAIHYRGAADAEIGKARASVRATMAGLAGGLRLMEGNKVWEILPSAIGDKGTAVLRKLNLFKRPVLAVYAGDDVTDEPAFAAVPQGVTIRVGPRSLTRAKYRLRDTGEVRIFLERLADELS